ncbi:hypothetical protein ACDX78_14315 [Virgibacillus oceani]
MKRASSTYIKNATIYLDDEIIKNGSILIEGCQITEVKSGRITFIPAHVQIVDATSLLAILGFIDGHIHGANGADMMGATEKALDAMQ